MLMVKEPRNDARMGTKIETRTHYELSPSSPSFLIRLRRNHYIIPDV